MGPPEDVFAALASHFGPQGWWPGETPFEVAVGALLMAQTSWGNVARAITNLKRAGALDPHVLAGMRLDRLRSLIRPAGLYRTKPRRLREFCRHLMDTTDGDLRRFLAGDPDAVRRDLLSLGGIGPETADSILLYAGEVTRFVVDAYTLRIGRRIGWFGDVGYDEAQAYFEGHRPRDLATYREDHALLVALGKSSCRPRPRCPQCPIRPHCAHGTARSHAPDRGKRRG